MDVVSGDAWERVPKLSDVEYHAYLRSDAWRQRRRLVFDRAGHRCQVCGATGGLDVHHNIYERLGHESPFDLVALCRDCHGRFHETSKVEADSLESILRGLYHGAGWTLEMAAYIVGALLTLALIVVFAVMMIQGI